MSLTDKEQTDLLNQLLNHLQSIALMAVNAQNRIGNPPDAIADMKRDASLRTIILARAKGYTFMEKWLGKKLLSKNAIADYLANMKREVEMAQKINDRISRNR